MADENARTLVENINKLLMRKYGGSGMDSQKRLFTEYDTDKDGKINAEELERLLKEASIGNGLTRGAWVRGVISKMDKDGDQRISWAEYEAVINETIRSL